MKRPEHHSSAIDVGAPLPKPDGTSARVANQHDDDDRTDPDHDAASRQRHS
ncbi:hypothetical protein [Gordonia sputi]|uniref:hypothetical protein n=1 Tax=Gordonia sputi TaxID=36823 RepID=UPI0036A37D10